jgi:hypothetical protein
VIAVRSGASAAIAVPVGYAAPATQRKKAYLCREHASLAHDVLTQAVDRQRKVDCSC